MYENICRHKTEPKSIQHAWEKEIGIVTVNETFLLSKNFISMDFIGIVGALNLFRIARVLNNTLQELLKNEPTRFWKIKLIKQGQTIQTRVSSWGLKLEEIIQC